MYYLSNCFIKLLQKNSHLEDIDIYRYGIEIIIADVSNFFVILIPGFILHKQSEAIIFLVTFICIRRNCGGYHCSNCFRCNICFLSIFLLSLLSNKYESFIFNIIFIICFVFLFFKSINIKYSILEIDKKKINYLMIINMSLIVICTYLFFPTLINNIKFTIIIISLLLLINNKNNILCKLFK